ncbi:GNAT family N-acetyltransferase [Rubrivirga sp. IMCC43871]|uniref:GNAT family N-acetyltransferase n=1 Tax=Rubrivirga sp. IMCC43871 TaxID=3391575 RepID=UPI00398F8E2C
METLASPSLLLSPSDVRIDRLDVSRYPEIQALNLAVFGDSRVIQRLDRDDLVLLLASVGGEPIGYKVGYRESASTFYSAKGGVLKAWRKRGVARALLAVLEQEAKRLGYARFAYDTFPNKHPGMTVLGLARGYTITAAGYNAAYRDFRLRFERDL